MKRLGKLILFLCCLLGTSNVSSQNFSAGVNKKAVALGDYFQLTFSLNANGGNFTPPDLKDFDILQGPMQSSQVSIINGAMSSNISITYYLGGKKEGKFTIGPAKITAGGKVLESNSVAVEILKGNASTQGNQSTNANVAGGSNENQRYDYSASGSGEDVFVKTYVSKQKCFLGEQLNVTHKIYSVHRIKGIKNFKPPAYTGFWSKDEDRNAQLSQKVENLDGTQYYVVEFNKTILFPQRSGTLTVDPVEIDITATLESKRKPRTLLEQFFGSGYEEKDFKLKSRKIDITVTALPDAGKPENFNGAVGSYTFRAELDKDKVKENDALNLKVVVGGKGNINLISHPNINFPPEFETYDPKVNENVSVSGVVSGSKTYEYLIIPRKRGNYTIKDFNFSYFDPEKKQYVTIPSPQLNITVEPGVAGSGTTATVYSPSKNDVAATENDIRYIKRGDLELKEAETEFFGSAKHYALIGLCFVLFIGGIAGRNYIVKTNSDVIAVKERKAAKMARKRLARAEKFKNENNKEGFYSEIHFALNKYISDKMNIPVAELSHDSIRNHMAEKKINTDTAEKFMKTLNECEYVKYAPGAVSDNLSDMYSNTVALVTEIEEQSKA
jgi:hypothetical protein